MAKKPTKPPPSYEAAVLDVLLWEYPFFDKAEIEKKIKDRLKRNKLGPYDPSRVRVLRRLKDQLQKEINKAEKSRYYTHPHHPVYCDERDFDAARILKVLRTRYPHVRKADLRAFIRNCIIYYYLL